LKKLISQGKWRWGWGRGCQYGNLWMVWGRRLWACPSSQWWTWWWRTMCCI